AAAAAASRRPQAFLSTSEAASRARSAQVKFRDEQGGCWWRWWGSRTGRTWGRAGARGVKEGGSLMGRFDSLVQTVVIPRVRTKNTAAGAAGAPGSALASTSAAVLPSQPGLSPVQSSSSPSPALPSLSSLSPSALPSPSALASPSGKVSVADRMKWYVARVKSPKQQGLYGGLGKRMCL
ncbi:hypothetical protein CLOP_g14292, partial [Closterium sp. NIES-67]